MFENYTWLIPAWLIIAPTVLIVMLLNARISSVPPRYSRDARLERDGAADGPA